MEIRSSAVRLAVWTEDDFALLRALNTPEMLAHLGGPESEEQLIRRHRRYVDRASDRPGAGRMYRVVTEDGQSAGNVGFWASTWQGAEVYETGWMILSSFQGRGLATAAALAVIEAARTEAERAEAGGVDEGRRTLHAFPEVANEASNAVCRKAGFEPVGACEIEYPAGRWMRSNEWRLDLAPPART